MMLKIIVAFLLSTSAAAQIIDVEGRQYEVSATGYVTLYDHNDAIVSSEIIKIEYGKVTDLPVPKLFSRLSCSVVSKPPFVTSTDKVFFQVLATCINQNDQLVSSIAADVLVGKQKTHLFQNNIRYGLSSKNTLTILIIISGRMIND